MAGGGMASGETASDDTGRSVRGGLSRGRADGAGKDTLIAEARARLAGDRPSCFPCAS